MKLLAVLLVFSRSRCLVRSRSRSLHLSQNTILNVQDRTGAAAACQCEVLSLYATTPRSPEKCRLQISSSLTWRSIQAGGKPFSSSASPIPPTSTTPDELSEAIVTLPTEVGSGDTVELAIGYEGTIALDATRLTRIGMPERKRHAHRLGPDQSGVLCCAVEPGTLVWYPVAMDAANLSDEGSLFEILGRWKVRESNAAVHIKLVPVYGRSETDRR